MANPIRFRVESNKVKSSFWYTLVSGNGNTTMTSKAKYSSDEAARRAARNQAEALQNADLVVEWENAEGDIVQEQASSPETVDHSDDQVAGFRRTRREGLAVPEPSLAPAQAYLNPNF